MLSLVLSYGHYLKLTIIKFIVFFPNNEVQYLHLRDGVFPEKLNQGRIGVGNIGHSIGKNPPEVVHW